MTSSRMGKTNTKQSDKETLAEVTKEMAKPRVATSARDQMAALDPMEQVKEASPSQARRAMLPTPSLNTTLKTLGLKATLLTWPT
jgi:hypothetical protein